MKKIALMDTSVGSYNHGDQIIMESSRVALKDITDGSFVVEMPTHNPLFHNIEFLKEKVGKDYNRTALARFDYKFVCGTNLLWNNMRHRFRQWNLTLFDLKYINDFILLGVGGGKETKAENRYTQRFYEKALKKDVYHSVRDEKAKLLLEGMGFKALNTGCVTLWSLEEEKMKKIPLKKSDSVVFTLTDYNKDPINDKKMINTLFELYEKVYFWPQGFFDMEYLNRLHIPSLLDRVRIIKPSLEEYDKFLKETECDYVGTRLHGGIKAIQCGKRSIIIGVDERAKNINDDSNLNYIARSDISSLGDYILSDITTDIRIHREEIELFLDQFRE